MIVRKNEDLSVNVRADNVAMTDFFGGVCPAGKGVSMGYAVFPDKTVVPPAAHTGDEYSYVVSGRIKCESNGVMHELCAGEAGFIPAGEVHRTVNDSGQDAAVVWMLIEKE